MKYIASIIFTMIALGALPPTRGALVSTTLYFAHKAAEKQRSGLMNLGAFSRKMTGVRK